MLTIFLNDTITKDYDFFSLLNYDVVIISPLHNDPSPHYHLILQHKNAMSFNVLKKLFPFAHIEKQFGTNIQAYNYLFHYGEDSKEQLNENDIRANIELDSWKITGDNDSTGKEILQAIEESETLWSVIKQFPQYWRDVSKIKELWNIYRLHMFRQNSLLYYSLTEQERKELNELNDQVFE